MNANQLYQAVIDKAELEIDELSLQRQLIEREYNELKRQLDDMQRRIWAKERTKRDATIALQS